MRQCYNSGTQLRFFGHVKVCLPFQRKLIPLPKRFQRTLYGTLSLCICTIGTKILGSESRHPWDRTTNTDNVLIIIQRGPKNRANLAPGTAQLRNALMNFTVLTAEY